MAPKTATAAVEKEKPPAVEKTADEMLAAIDERGNATKLGMPELEGWFSAEDAFEKKGFLYGEICGAFAIPPNDQNPRGRDALVIKLLKPCPATVDNKSVILKEGQYAGLSIRADLTELMYYVESDATIFVKPARKKALSKGRKMWVFDTRVTKGKRSEKRFFPEVKNKPGDIVSDDEGDGDIPF